MKFIKQFMIILFISLIGEVLHSLIDLPIPASIYGMCLMFICLATGLVKLDSVKDCAKYLIEIMPVMFIPAAVGVMAAWDQLKPIVVPVVVIMCVTTVVVMVVTGKVSQLIIRRKSK